MKQESGYALIQNCSANKSTAFTLEEREKFGLRGLLPHRVSNIQTQEKRVLWNLRRKESDIEKYIFLTALQERNERLYYRIVVDNIEEIMPLIYTPTVGQACNEFANIFRKPKGFYITPTDKGEIRNMLDNWPEEDVKVVVITDGQRILGLGDLGSNGMGIPIGKLALYVACAGIHPRQCLPVMLDVGTNNEELIDDPLYLGYPKKRIEGQDYLALVDEFMNAIHDKYPKALIQFEDFLTPNAFQLLNKYRDLSLCFNDDIQGTAAVTLAGIYASTRITKHDFSNLRIMFLGAGAAATGIGDLVLSALIKSGLSKEEARRRLWFVDRNGLIVKSRRDVMEHCTPYAHEHEQLNFINAIKTIKPHILIGATGTPGTFNREVIEAMCEINEKPAIFALSNPTSKAECTAEQAYEWSDGKAIFTSGSPFKAVRYNEEEHQPGQGNNAYVFPGIGLGALACDAKIINDEMFLEAAKALAHMVSQESLGKGTLYPPLTEIRKVSLEIAIAVAREAYKHDLAQAQKPEDIRRHVASMMYDPNY